MIIIMMMTIILKEEKTERISSNFIKSINETKNVNEDGQVGEWKI